MLSTRYQKRLKNYILKFGIVITVVGFLGFILILFIYTSSYSFYRTVNYNKSLSKSFEGIYKMYMDYINDRNTLDTFTNCLNKEISVNYMSYMFNTFDLKNEITSDIILCDADGNVEYTSFTKDEINLHLELFNKSIHNNLSAKISSKIYNTVYYFDGDYSKYVFSRAVYDDGELKGSISIYLNGYDWNYQMKMLQFDGIITDMAGNIIACSNRSMVDSLNQFKPTQKLIYTIENQTYWMKERMLGSYGVKVYTFVNHTTSKSYYYIGCLAFSVILLFLMIAIKQFAGKIANINSASVEALLYEINVIRQGDFDYRITLETEDEFENISAHINDMLDKINGLSKRNMDLLKLNSIMEAKQLEAQFNPHFLYNTLESIRYSIRLNPKDADKIILNLTSLLRWSIKDATSQVTLGDDLKYLIDYLEIIKYRFQGRFFYDMDIGSECYDCHVPKLLLQPILENSMKYGFKHKKTLRIKIRGWMKDGILYLEIVDNGFGMKDEQLSEVKAMINLETDGKEHKGLYNIARRLKLQYGESSGIEIQSIYEKGTTIRLKIAEGVKQ